MEPLQLVFPWAVVHRFQLHLKLEMALQVPVFAKVLSKVLCAYHIPKSNSCLKGKKLRQPAGLNSGIISCKSFVASGACFSRKMPQCQPCCSCSYRFFRSCLLPEQWVNDEVGCAMLERFTVIAIARSCAAAIIAYPGGPAAFLLILCGSLGHAYSFCSRR